MHENKYIVLGILGALIALYGTTQAFPQPYYLAGAVVLFATATYYKLFYFIALELILIASHLAIIFGLGRYTQFALPVLLCIQLFIFYLMLGKENNLFLILGICGIALLSIGQAYNNQWIFFVGNIFIASYAYYNGYKSCPPAYIWAILNTAFAFLCLYKIYFELNT